MTEKPFDLSGKVALVTGGGRGIGAAIVTRFAEAGATVMIANRSRDVADDLAKDLTGRGLRVEAVPFDRLDRKSLHGTIDRVAGQDGRLDILVHNAGGCLWSSLEKLDEHKLDETLSLNLKAAFWLAQAAIPRMRANGFGRILVTPTIRQQRPASMHSSAARRSNWPATTLPSTAWKPASSPSPAAAR